MGRRGCVSLSCVKTWFLVFTAVLWLIAAGLFGIGVWTLVAKNEYETLLGSVTYVTTVGLMLAGGLFAMFVCIFGIIGAIKESRFMVLGFFLMIVIVCLIELVGGIIAYVYRGKLNSEVERSLRITIATSYGLSGNEKKTEAIDKLQKNYKCCGDVDYKSWEKSEWWLQQSRNSNQSFRVPDSCCISPSKGCADDRNHPSNIWRNDLSPLGCFSALEDYLLKHLFIIGIACIVSGLAQIICIVLSMWLYRLIVEFR
ncbi:CD151 antigen-like [Hydractinia symbiolongicarpus]|uniref:CD151 antigen-like n=1 Tax=Hydractinia symbiolongicarpus TaxID=13093 RepID=UPI00254DB618|nr:CD151 antigen-like [Hydractinia symbiolongicarpus]